MPPYPNYPENPSQEAPASFPEDKPESLPIDESGEEAALVDGGEELPEDWEDDVSDEELPGDEPVEPVPEEPEEFPAAEETPAEELSEEDEPVEEEAAAAEEPTTEEPLFEEEPEELPAADEPAAEAKPEKSGRPEEKPIKDKIVGLMDYLKGLTSALPENKRENFMKSDARLSMEYVINALKGKKGLLKEIKEKVPETRAYRPSTPEVPDNQQVAGTLSYLGNLTSALPDKDLFSALKQKVQRIMSRIKAVTEKRK
jgi:hypothetical protein